MNACDDHLGLWVNGRMQAWDMMVWKGAGDMVHWGGRGYGERRNRIDWRFAGEVALIVPIHAEKPDEILNGQTSKASSITFAHGPICEGSLRILPDVIVKRSSKHTERGAHSSRMRCSTELLITKR